MIKSLTAIGKQFQAENPGASVEFIFAGSADLSAELADRNDADVFVSGDPDNMAAVANAGLVDGHPAPLASNSLVIAVAPGNHDNLATFADLARPGLRVAVCGGTGASASATQRIEDRTGVRLHPTAVDRTAKGVLKDVATGRVDAGLVLKTDALSAGDNVSWFEFPEAADAVVTSWIALMKNSDRAGLAAKFINDVTGPAGMKVIADDGFAEPVTSYGR
jgi:molybdate transport system substrate-binding protein